MMRALLALRLRAMLAGMTAQARQKKKGGKGMTVLFAVLYLYLAVVVCFIMVMLFGQLAPVYHAQGLDWLYFDMAGLMALGLSIFGSVFTTQSQLYDAKDNDLLLSMPIRPGLILLSRMVPLILINLVFCGLVILPAAGVYAAAVKFSAVQLLAQVLGLIGTALLAQGIACLLGWGMHLLLQKMNKSLASLLFMVIFLGIYFSVYSQTGNLLSALATSGGQIGSALKSWVWPIYALGVGCEGSVWHLLAFLLICGAVFGAVYFVLAKTFLLSATARSGGKRRKLDLTAGKVGSPTGAMIYKEWKHFLASPVYLTNLGLGILMTAALAVAGILFREKLLALLGEFAAMGLDLTGYLPLIICALLGVMNAMMFLSAPSVSLEGQNLWILKSMPLGGGEILRAKMGFHFVMTTPVTVAAGIILAICYGCNWVEILLCGLVPGGLTVLGNLVGMIFGLQWARLDWLSEAYPCKQGAAVGITMLVMMVVPILLAALYWGLRTAVSPVGFLLICTALLSVICLGLYRVVMTWGVKKWNRL